MVEQKRLEPPAPTRPENARRYAIFSAQFRRILLVGEFVRH